MCMLKYIPADTDHKGQSVFAGDVVVSSLLGLTLLHNLITLSVGVLFGITLGTQEIFTSALDDGQTFCKAALRKHRFDASQTLRNLKFRFRNRWQC